MFKHVELMRKSAIRIMSKTFGGRSKDKNEPIYDAYPLRTLVKLLCFENMDEAKAACVHYNITVKPTKIRTSAGVITEDVVYWRHSSFKEPRDPDKGTLIPLFPRKMVKTIESKLKGATRLAVCRGQVSGDGAFLTSGAAALMQGSAAMVSETPEQAQQRAEALRAVRLEEEKRRAKEAERRREQEEAKRREDDDRRRLAEQQKQAELQKERIKEERKQQEMAANLQREKAEKERFERIRLEEERRQKQLEMEREAARSKLEEEERQRQLEIERREVLRLEQERQRKEEEERKRKAEEERLRKIEEERVRREAEELERIRKEEEEKRRKEMEREEAARRQLDAEELRLDQAWAKATAIARKKLLWGMLLRKIPKSLKLVESTHEALSHLDSTSPSPWHVNGSLSQPYSEDLESQDNFSEHSAIDFRRIMESSLKQDVQISIADMLLESFVRTKEQLPSWAMRRCTTTVLFTLSIVVPFASGIRNQSLCDLVVSWAGSRLAMDRVTTIRKEGVDVRVAVVNANDEANPVPSDAALILIPPPWCDSYRSQEMSKALDDLVNRVDKTVPVAIMAFPDSKQGCSPSHCDNTASKVASAFERALVLKSPDLDQDDIEANLCAACSAVASAFLEECPLSVDRVPITRLGLLLIHEAVLYDDSIEVRDDLVVHAKTALRYLVDVLDEVYNEDELLPHWPTSSFAVNSGVRAVPEYFGPGADLPLDWALTLKREYAEPELAEVGSLFDGTFPEVVNYLLFDAPMWVLHESKSFLDKRMFKRCLQHAVRWREQRIEYEEGEPCAYLPSGILGEVLRRAVEKFTSEFGGKAKTTRKEVQDDDMSSYYLFSFDGRASDAGTRSTMEFTETIDAPPVETPMPNPVDGEEDSFSRASHKRRHDDTEYHPHEWKVPVEETPLKRMRKANDEDVSDSGGARSRDVQKRSPKQRASRELRRSRAFSAKLDRYLSGDTEELIVGNVPLSSLLRGAPDLSRAGSPFS